MPLIIGPSHRFGRALQKTVNRHNAAHVARQAHELLAGGRVPDADTLKLRALLRAIEMGDYRAASRFWRDLRGRYRL